MSADHHDRTLFRGIFLVAFATLLYEITLIRLLSFTIWYHFAYVVISTALLGFGASGTLIAVRPQIGTRQLRETLAWSSLLAAATASALLLLVSLLPLHPMRIIAEPDQLALLLLYQLGAVIPFFFSGIVISLSLRAAALRVDRLYFWDLLGAGFGCAAAVMLMDLLGPPGSALVAGAIFALAALVYTTTPSTRVLAVGVAAALLIAAPLGVRISFTPADSKHLSIHIQAQKMVPVFSRWTALFRTDVVEKRPGLGPPFTRSDEWGLSAEAPDHTLQAPRFFITHDGSAGTGVFDLNAGNLAYLDWHILRFPYLVANPKPRVLVIGVGGGRDVLTALHYDAVHVTGVELDPVTVELLETELDGPSKGVFRGEDVTLVAGEGRHFVKRTDDRFDLIQITGVDTLAAQSSGAYVLAENYLYTVEAFHDYFSALTPGGLLSITTGHLNSTKPRAAARMVSVAQQSLRERGIERPQDHIAAIDSWRLFAAVLVSPTPFSAAQRRRLAEYTKTLRFQVLQLEGYAGQPVFEGLASTTGAERAELLTGLEYLVNATTDDAPFFFRFFRWAQLFDPEVEALSTTHLSALGQVVLLTLLVTLTMFGAVLIVGPLFLFRRRGIGGAWRQTLGVLVYFLAIGVGFMLFVISLMQRFVLYLGYPTYSLSVTLFSLLIFLGWGSFLSRRWVDRERVVLPLAVGAIAALTWFYMQGLPVIQDHTLGMSLAVRIALSVAMLAPLGLVLGAFLPLGIRRAADISEDLVPWAWAINGCASVTSSVLAVVLAMSFGFQWVWMLSIGVYAVGAAAFLLSARS